MLTALGVGCGVVFADLQAAPDVIGLPPPSVFQQAPTPSDVLPAGVATRISELRVDESSVRRARTGAGRTIFVGLQRDTSKLCLVATDGETFAATCNPASVLESEWSSIPLVFDDASRQKFFVAIVADGTSAISAGARQDRAVANVVALPLPSNARSVSFTIGGAERVVDLGGLV